MSFKLSNEAKAEKSIDVRENDKDVREIDVHLAEVLRLIDPFDFVPAVPVQIAKFPEISPEISHFLNNPAVM